MEYNRENSEKVAKVVKELLDVVDKAIDSKEIFLTPGGERPVIITYFEKALSDFCNRKSTMEVLAYNEEKSKEAESRIEIFKAIINLFKVREQQVRDQFDIEVSKANRKQFNDFIGSIL